MKYYTYSHDCKAVVDKRQPMRDGNLLVFVADIVGFLSNDRLILERLVSSPELMRWVVLRCSGRWLRSAGVVWGEPALAGPRQPYSIFFDVYKKARAETCLDGFCAGCIVPKCIESQLSYEDNWDSDISSWNVKR